MTKKFLKKEIDTMYFGGGTAEDTIEELQALIDVHGAGNITLDTRTDRDDSYYIAVMLSRLETDAEKQIREFNEARYKVTAEERERNMYETLKKKFG